MKRKRRQDYEFGKQKNSTLRYPQFEIPSKSVRESQSDYTVSDIAQAFSRFLDTNGAKTEKGSSASNRTKHVENVLRYRTQFYQNFKSPINVLESFIEHVESITKNSSISSTVINAAKRELLNIENVFIYLWLVWKPQIAYSQKDVHSILQNELSVIQKSLRSRRIIVRSELIDTSSIYSNPELAALCIRNILTNISEISIPNSELFIQSSMMEDNNSHYLEMSFKHSFRKEDIFEDSDDFIPFPKSKHEHIEIGLSISREIMLVMGGDLLTVQETKHIARTILRFPVNRE